MKTFTTLTAVAALVAGISIANAQGTTSPAPMGGAASQGQQQAIGTSPFCIETSAGGALNCKYASCGLREKTPSRRT